MTDGMKTGGRGQRQQLKADPIIFGRKLAQSDNFKALFREGMGLVEETASYLDGPGREEARQLPRAGSLAFATESMRLTTRLMQLASWLLLQRAVNEGEMSSDQARQEKQKLKLDTARRASDSPGWDDLPEMMRDLIDRSFRLRERILRLEEAMERDDEAEFEGSANPVADQLGRLSSALNARHAD
ncbi:DUF1465 family protein [Coralliovum pocilloporae]|uniref:protease adaptor protein RcdA n=1 Tax=Coralliovum pocilloporae TaxID=3066369 RepID=UPI0033078B5B